MTAESSGLTFELRALQRDLQALDDGTRGEASQTVVDLVRAARRISRLALEVAAAPGRAGAARDEVSLVRLTDACLGDGDGRVEEGDLEAAIALIARRLASAPAGAGGEVTRVQRTLAAIANLPDARAE